MTDFTKEFEENINWNSFFPQHASTEFLDTYKSKLDLTRLFITYPEYQILNNLIRYKDDIESSALDQMLHDLKINTESEYNRVWNTFKNSNYKGLAKRDDFPTAFPIEQDYQYLDSQILQMLPNIPEKLIDERLLFLGDDTTFHQYYRNKLSPEQVIKLADNNVGLYNLAVFQSIPIEYLLDHYNKFPIQEIYMYQELTSEDYYNLVDKTKTHAVNEMRSSIQFSINELIEFYKSGKYSLYEIARYGFTSKKANEYLEQKHPFDDLNHDVAKWNILSDENLKNIKNYIDLTSLFDNMDDYSAHYPKSYSKKVEQMYPNEYTQYLKNLFDDYLEDYDF